MKLRIDMGFTVASNAQKFAVMRALESVLAGVCKNEQGGLTLSDHLS